MNKGDEKERVAEKRKRLQALFPQLAEETQSYMLGLAQGLKTAQENGLITAKPYYKFFGEDIVQNRLRGRL